MVESGHITIITDDSTRHEFPDAVVINTAKLVRIIDRKTAKIIRQFKKTKVLWEIHH